LRDCLLTVHGEHDALLGEKRVVIPPLPERSLLDRLYREHLRGTHARYAVAREGRTVRAVWLSEELVPETAVRTPEFKPRRGSWVTTVVPLGGLGRGFAGPDIFFRQVDLGYAEAWMAAVLMGFGQDVDVRELVLGNDRVLEWEMRGERFYYRARGGRWAVYGAGNTPQERIDDVLASRKPADAETFLWEIGAIKL
jgi:hypothetical protein